MMRFQNHQKPMARLLSRFLLFLLPAAFSVVAAACGGSASDTPDSGDGSSTVSVESSEDSGGDDSSGSSGESDAGISSDSSGDSRKNISSGNGTDDSSSVLDYRDVVAEQLAIYLDYDSCGAQFDLALAAVESYLEGSSSLTDTEAEIETIRAALTEDYDLALTDYTVSDELSAALEENGILPEEFEYFADLRAYQASEYLSWLDILDSYLPYADEYDFEWENVSFWHELHSTLQDAYRGYYFYGSLNYWFAEWDEDETAYVQDTVIPCLECYIPETWVWETTQTAAEEKTMSYLDIVEECVEIQAEFLAESTEEVNALKRMLEDMN